MVCYDDTMNMMHKSTKLQSPGWRLRSYTLIYSSYHYQILRCYKTLYITMTDPYDLERFVTGQRGQSKTSYPGALQQIQQGKRTHHWIWYIFPQFDGLANSRWAKYYAIQSLDEAESYLEHDVLGPRLVEITEAVLDSKVGTSIELMGSYLDSEKVRSSMTLFMNAHAKPEKSVFKHVLDKYFDGKPDRATEVKLNENNHAEEDDDGIDTDGEEGDDAEEVDAPGKADTANEADTLQEEGTSEKYDSPKENGSSDEHSSSQKDSSSDKDRSSDDNDTSDEDDISDEDTPPTAHLLKGSARKSAIRPTFKPAVKPGTKASGTKGRTTPAAKRKAKAAASGRHAKRSIN
jgi:uncharacterized protein (DUF1810 family)